MAAQDSFATGGHQSDDVQHRHRVGTGGLLTPASSPEGIVKDGSLDMEHGLVDQWVEMFDYAGGARFRGFVAGDGEEKTLFVFFDEGVTGNDLKPGLMALLEICELPEFDCSKLVACLDRHAHPVELATLSRDLGWVGFEPYTLVDWTDGDDIVSHKWLFLSMDV